MRRRDFITLLGGAAAGWPLVAHAQQISKPARLGYIWIGTKDSEHSTRDGLRQGLRDLGQVEGRDFVLEERYAESKPDRLPEIVAELMRLNVALFLSPGVQVTRALVHGTSTIPIIATTPDLLTSGFVTRRGGRLAARRRACAADLEACAPRLHLDWYEGFGALNPRWVAAGFA
jgi:putative ABC transport system substrate-binding protein